MPDTSARSTLAPCARSPRSLRSAAAAVGLTGALLVVVPFGLLLGKNGLVPVSASHDEPIPAPRLTACDTHKPVASHVLNPGQCVRIVGSGFHSQELIEVADSRDSSWRTYVRADDDGRFSLRHVAKGPDVLTFVGQDHSSDSGLPRVTYCRFLAPSAAGN